LHLCLHLNQKEYMRILNGDKDTYRFAWLATNTPFHMVEHRVLPLGMVMSADQSFCGQSMLQHDIDGNPLFVHHNKYKQYSHIHYSNVMMYVQSAHTDHDEVVVPDSFMYRQTGLNCVHLRGIYASTVTVTLVRPSGLGTFESVFRDVWRNVTRELYENADDKS
jgi:hypothetical protein